MKRPLENDGYGYTPTSCPEGTTLTSYVGCPPGWPKELGCSPSKQVYCKPNPQGEFGDGYGYGEPNPLLNPKSQADCGDSGLVYKVVGPKPCPPGVLCPDAGAKYATIPKCVAPETASDCPAGMVLSERIVNYKISADGVIGPIEIPNDFPTKNPIVKERTQVVRKCVPKDLCEKQYENHLKICGKDNNNRKINPAIVESALGFYYSPPCQTKEEYIKKCKADNGIKDNVVADVVNTVKDSVTKQGDYSVFIWAALIGVGVYLITKKSE